MSKFMKELMSDQLEKDLGGERSLLILDLKGLDAVAEHKMRMDFRKKKIVVRVLKNSLARRVFDQMGMPGLGKYLTGPSVGVWGGAGVAELAKEVSAKVKELKKPEIKGGVVDGTVIGPEQVADITKLPSREALIGRVVQLAQSPGARIATLLAAPGGQLQGQIKALVEKLGGGESEAEAGTETPAEGEAAPAAE